MKNTAIQWTDHTINFWWGCTEVSRACQHCYARDFANYASKRIFGATVEWGKGKPRAERLEKARAEALALNRQAEKKGTRYRVFANSMSDWLDNEVPIEWLVHLLATIHMTSSLDWQLLTKRPEQWQSRIHACLKWIEATPGWDDLDNTHPMVQLRNWLANWFVLGILPQNVWIGTTVENQVMADTRVPELLKIPAAVRFLSCEPLMERIVFKKCLRRCTHGCNYEIATDNPLGHWGSNFDFTDPARPSVYCPTCRFGLETTSKIHWVIVGGESGNYKDEKGKPPTLKPLHPDWVRSLQRQCDPEFNNIPFFFKQWGEWLPVGQQDPAIVLPAKLRGHRDPLTGQLWLKAGTARSGRFLDGKQYSEFPRTVYAPFSKELSDNYNAQADAQADQFVSTLAGLNAASTPQPSSNPHLP